MRNEICELIRQGFLPGKCRTRLPDGSYQPACQATLKKVGGTWHRVIASAHLSRPEDYFSIYQSGCNHECLKCHSWHFSQNFHGFWTSTDEIAEMASDYELTVTVREPRERATMWHATDLCHHCGLCVTAGVRGDLCPAKLHPEQILLSPQGYGPARNIISFTGGDIGCRAEFYVQAAEKIRAACTGDMWVLLETNGYGLTPKNLDLMASAGLDSFWLDIKAYEDETYRKLCGTTNKWILQAPEWIVDRGFVLEVLSLLIPGWVEMDQISKIAQHLSCIDQQIPFTLLAFFPEYKLRQTRAPTLDEMLRAYIAVKDAGLRNVKVGNCHIFARTEEDWELLTATVGKNSIG